MRRHAVALIGADLSAFETTAVARQREPTLIGCGVKRREHRPTTTATPSLLYVSSRSGWGLSTHHVLQMIRGSEGKIVTHQPPRSPGYCILRIRRNNPRQSSPQLPSCFLAVQRGRCTVEDWSDAAEHAGFLLRLLLGSALPFCCEPVPHRHTLPLGYVGQSETDFTPNPPYMVNPKSKSTIHRPSDCTVHGLLVLVFGRIFFAFRLPAFRC